MMTGILKVYKAMSTTCNGDPGTQYLRGRTHISLVHYPGKLFWYIPHIRGESIPSPNQH